jgi:hypothetical protein
VYYHGKILKLNIKIKNTNVSWKQKWSIDPNYYVKACLPKCY